VTRRLLLLLVCVAAAGVGRAHEVRPALLELTETAPGHFQVLWKEPLAADRRLPLEPVLPDACAGATGAGTDVAPTARVRTWQVRCSLREGVITIAGLSGTLTDVMVLIRHLDGEVRTALLRPGEPAFDLGDPTPGAGAYFRLGVEHLLFGIDHLLFLIGLVLFISQPWMLVKTVTAFTIAHSFTLALSVLELVTLPQGPVEAVIALSILFLARELVRTEEARSRLMRTRPWVMAFAFGLLHGFGFAGALAELGLPRDALAASLVLFNLGIEAGQLLVIAVIAAGAWGLRRLAAGPPPVFRQGVVAAIGSVAAFWTIDRVVLLF
jgi:hydrogenase/urease accessory protein HupE